MKKVVIEQAGIYITRDNTEVQILYQSGTGFWIGEAIEKPSMVSHGIWRSDGTNADGRYTWDIVSKKIEIS